MLHRLNGNLAFLFTSCVSVRAGACVCVYVHLGDFLRIFLSNPCLHHLSEYTYSLNAQYHVSAADGLFGSRSRYDDCYEYDCNDDYYYGEYDRALERDMRYSDAPVVSQTSSRAGRVASYPGRSSARAIEIQSSSTARYDPNIQQFGSFIQRNRMSGYTDSIYPAPGSDMQFPPQPSSTVVRRRPNVEQIVIPQLQTLEVDRVPIAMDTDMGQPNLSEFQFHSIIQGTTVDPPGHMGVHNSIKNVRYTAPMPQGAFGNPAAPVSEPMQVNSPELLVSNPLPTKSMIGQGKHTFSYSEKFEVKGSGTFCYIHIL